MSEFTSSKPRELLEFHEVINEFRSQTVDAERIVVVFKDSSSIVLPRSAHDALKQLKIGQRIAILRISEDSIVVRRA